MNIMKELPTEHLSVRDFNKYYVIRYKGKIVSYLQPSHVKMANQSERPNITVQVLKNIRNTHRNIFRLCDAIEKEEDPSKLKVLASKITDLDFKLQELWGFDKDIKYHSWWYRLPKCICPVLDNQDALGTSACHYTSSCPLHGESPQE